MSEDSCCGTGESSIIWYNYIDTAGLICSILVWSSFIFAWGASLYFYLYGYFNLAEEIIVTILMAMTGWCHAKVIFSDPGAVPKKAAPYNKDKSAPYTMCGRCDAYKPPKTHHGISIYIYCSSFSDCLQYYFIHFLP